MRILLFVLWLLCISLPVRATDFGDIPASTDVSTLWASFAFKTISVSGQSDVVADAPADTLTLAAGSNITITTDATTDTITITGSTDAPTTAHYVTTQAESGLSAEFSLGSLSSGLLKQTVSASVATPAIATEGSDYLGSARIDDTAYNATTWDSDTTHAPSKNAVRDKFESLVGTIPTISDTAFGSSWNGVTTIAPSKNAVYDEIHLFDTGDDGSIINAGTGFRIGGAAASGKILVGNGTNYVASTPTFPNASATSGKIIKSDGTNWIASTETYAAPGTSGNILTSDGTNWTSAAATGSGSPYVSASADNADTNIASTSYVTVLSKSVTLSANSTLIIDLWGSILNNTGGSVTWSYQVNVGAVAVFDYSPVANVASQATSRTPQVLRYVISPSATNVWRAIASITHEGTVSAAGAVNGSQAGQTIWNNGTNDFTGAQTITFKVKSNGNTATQTFTLHSYAIQVIPQT